MFFLGPKVTCLLYLTLINAVFIIRLSLFTVLQARQYIISVVKHLNVPS